MDRRKFVTTLAGAGVAGSALGLAGCGGGAAPTGAAGCEVATTSTEAIEWKMVTTWPRDFPGLGAGANHLAQLIGELSGGRLTVRVFGGGELVPPFEIFDAVARGTAEMGHGAAYYWKGKIPAAQFFSGVPFGFTAQEINSWMYHGGGLELYREVYRPFGVMPFVVGNSGTQMGGWFNREINTVDDLKGLKMRIPGIGGEVLKRAGGTPVNIPGQELFTALQTGTIDATEWVGPMNDLAFGLFRAAPYYYSPGWHEPGTALEGLVNQQAWDALPADLQSIVATACKAATLDMLSDFTAHNGPALNSLVHEHGVELRSFPPEVLAQLQKLTLEVLDELAGADETAGRVYRAIQAFHAQVQPWTAASERAYLAARAG